MALGQDESKIFIKSMQPGTYIVAVSGGVDSMSLLHILNNYHASGLKLIVAHFDHGIRTDTADDIDLVKNTAQNYGLEFLLGHGRLGAGASEAAARKARYSFLQKCRKQCGGVAIITAHHQDDVIETAAINLIRGTGIKGLSALKNQTFVKRPLLDATKLQIEQYAKQNNIQWRQDYTNSDENYLRNRVRRLLQSITSKQRHDLLNIIKKSGLLSTEMDAVVKEMLKIDNKNNLKTTKNSVMERDLFCALPYSVAKTVMAFWLRTNKIAAFDSKAVERLTLASKAARIGTRHNIYGNKWLIVNKDSLHLDMHSNLKVLGK